MWKQTESKGAVREYLGLRKPASGMIIAGSTGGRSQCRRARLPLSALGERTQGKGTGDDAALLGRKGREVMSCWGDVGGKGLLDAEVGRRKENEGDHRSE